jgi:pyruvate/2-oxoglutarate dehydrogenase complex dihydrolipoamide dehydrogenase (E3) component
MLGLAKIFLFLGTMGLMVWLSRWIPSAWQIPLLAAFILLGSLGGLALEGNKRRKIYAKFTAPSHYDYDVIVIGAGSGGLSAAHLTAALKGKVLLIEKERMGGDSLYAGCVPSKSLIRSAGVAQLFRRGNEFGLQSVTPQPDFSRIFTRIHNVIKKIEPHDSAERYTAMGVECLKGEAKIADPFRVHWEQKIFTTRNIIVATGACPVIPDIKGLSDVPFYTSETLWQMQWVPKKLLVMGGGPIGCELAQAFQRLGCETVLVEQRGRLLRREDADVADTISRRFTSEGIQIKLSSEIMRVEKKGNGGRAHFKTGESLDFDAVLVALGRRPRTSGFGLQELGIGTRPDGTIETDSSMRTVFPNIFVVGDATGPFQFTHAAAHQARVAALNALFAPLKNYKADYAAMPWCTYLDPEIARVGINETMASERGLDVDVHKYSLEDLDRAICEGENQGLIKVITPRGRGNILGVTVVGARAGDTIAEFVLAMRKGLTLDDILKTAHSYPTFAEANQIVAGIWKEKTASPQALRLLGRFHAWRRG